MIGKWERTVCCRHVKDFLLGSFAAYGAVWVVIESISAFFKSIRPEGLIWYSVLLALAAIGGIVHAWLKKRVEFPIPGSDSSLEIRFGDIFEGKAVTVIPVNEYFDGELGDHVSEKSLHGKFIRDILGGQSKTFFDLTSNALANVKPKEAGVARVSGRCDKYAIGTVARLDDDVGRCFLLVALSHTDLSSLKAYATVHDLWTCLAGVWSGIRDYSNGRPAAIPLVGSGLSGIGLPARHLIEIIVTSFLYHTKEGKVADRVALVLPRRMKGQVDLNSTSPFYDSNSIGGHILHI